MEQLPPLDNTLGAVYIGVVLSAALYGVSCSQVFYYFQHYCKKDGPATKALVVATLVSDTVHQALISHVAYVYVITGYYTPQMLGNIVWSLVVEVIFNAITALLVQTFFAVRIWRFSQKNLPLTAVLSLLIGGGFVSAIVFSAKALSMSTFVELSALRPLSVAVNALAAAGDVFITVVLCALLHRARTGLRSSDTMINLLIAFSVQTGMLTSLCAVASLISITVSPNTFIYICFYFFMGRLYCNSLLATLNVRRAIRERAHDGHTMSLRPIGGSSGSSTDNRKEIRIRTETEQYVSGEKSRNRSGSLVFVQSTNEPQVIEDESDLESGRGGQLRVLASKMHLGAGPVKSEGDSISSV